MTINKSQGQTLDFVRLYLKNFVFSHEQLYAALSRTTSRNGVKILLHSNELHLQGCTKNIVCNEVFEEVKQRIQ